MKETESHKKPLPSASKVIRFFLKPYKLSVTALFILSVLAGVFETASVATIYPILSSGLDIKPLQGNFLFSVIDVMAAILPIKDVFISYCIFFILIAVLTFVIKLTLVYLRARVIANLVSRNKTNIFKKHMAADYQYFIDHKQGELIYLTSTAPMGIASLMTALTTILPDAILVISIFALLFSVSWVGALGAILLAVGYYYITQYLGTKISYFTGKGRAQASGRENVVLNEVISGIRQVKVFLMQNSWIKKFNSAVKEFWAYYRKDTVWLQIPALALVLLLYSLLAIVVIILKIRNPADFIQFMPAFGTFGLALFRLLPSISQVGMLRMNVMSSLPNCELVYAALNTKPDHITDGQKELTALKSSISLEHVSFAHKSRSKTLEDVSFTIAKGKVTAIVGASGAGKTTVVDLLLRLFDPDKGQVKVDGVDLKEYKLSSWLNKIGFVSQDTFIFHDTARSNITFGSDGFSDEEVIKAAKEANAHNFIAEFPEGYNTILGDRGMRLSGGQRQRIAIARAMIRNPEILILDEATSALDNVSEALVQEAIKEVAKNRTVIIIAHRLSTVAGADKIIVLENGRVLEEGTHQELIAKQGAYWELYGSQPK
jgi:ABC-type multidrug transport system fused ATPase/permease subunit